jgi:hypothetical protein
VAEFHLVFSPRAPWIVAVIYTPPHVHVHSMRIARSLCESVCTLHGLCRVWASPCRLRILCILCTKIAQQKNQTIMEPIVTAGLTLYHCAIVPHYIQTTCAICVNCGLIGKYVQYGTYDICPRPVFWCEFNGGVRFVIRLTIYGNFSIYIPLGPIFWCKFNDGVHLAIGITIFGPVFRCEFNGGVYFVIRLAIFGNLQNMQSIYLQEPVFQHEFKDGVCCDQTNHIW